MASVSHVHTAAPTPAAPPRGGGPLVHADASAASRTDLTGGRSGRITTEELPNGVRMIIAERPGAERTKVQVGIGAGSYQDPEGKTGLAHLLEHLAFEGSPTRSAPVQEHQRTTMGGMWNAYTDRDSVVYYGVAPNSDATRAAGLLTDMFKNPATTGKRVPQELAAVKNEMIFGDGSLRGEEWHIGERLLFGDTAATTNVIGSRDTVEAITAKDLNDFHRNYFVGRNTVALVEGDPEHLPLATLRRELGQLPAGSRVDNANVHPTLQPGQAMQVVNDTTSGTVRISAMVPVPTEVVGSLKTPPSLITSSIGNELNDRLRRNHHLTYGAGVRLEPADETNSPNHFVLTATADVEPGNARRAMNDLVATLKDAEDGFGPKTFEKYKAESLARIRAAEAKPSTVSQRAENAFQDALLNPGVDVPAGGGAVPKRSMAASVGRVTADDFAKDAGAMIDLSNLKVLAVGPVKNGESLRAGIRDAGLSTRTLKMNPVNLSYYKDMGIAVPRAAAPKPR